MTFILHFTLLLILPTAAMNNGDYIYMLMLPITVIGVLLNRYVMSQNGVKMPVKMNAEIAPFVSERRAYRPITDSTRHSWLGDCIPIRYGKTLRMVSVGDLFVWIGCALAWLYISVLILRGSGFL